MKTVQKKVTAYTFYKCGLVDFVAVTRQHKTEIVVLKDTYRGDSVFLLRAAEVGTVIIFLSRAVEG